MLLRVKASEIYRAACLELAAGFDILADTDRHGQNPRTKATYEPTMIDARVVAARCRNEAEAWEASKVLAWIDPGELDVEVEEG